MLYALSQPPSADVNEILVRPTGQALQPRRATPPWAPEGRQLVPAQSTLSKPPVSNDLQCRPPSGLRSLPPGPTARTVPPRQAGPERYPGHPGRHHPHVLALEFEIARPGRRIK